VSTRLQLYNNALLDIGERTLATLTENREPRRLLDIAWDSGAIDMCLEMGQWNFAMRSIKLEYSPSVEPTWGYRRAFDKPTDYIRTAALCSDEYFKSPLLEYVDEASFWFADLDVLYVRYVSNDASYGGDMNKWPASFDRVVSAYLGTEVIAKITQDKARAEKQETTLMRALERARATDAMNQPTAIPPPSRWSSARAGRRTRFDGGNSGSLIG
jgi:hypothetical protein